MKKVLYICILLNTIMLNAKIINYCEPPEKAIAFSTKAEEEMYDTIVERYKDCTLKFIDEQKKQIKLKEKEISEEKDAISKAIKRWNNF